MYEITQFMAMIVVWVSRQDIPGSMDPHDQLDLFDYSPHDGFVCGSTVKLDANNIFNGVQFYNPTNFFSPVEHLDEGEQPDQVYLRPALVLFYHLLQDLT